MAKKYKFDLTVDSTALLQVNPTEFYSKLYGIETAVANFRVVPGIKNATKLATVLFDQITKDAACDFTATNSTVSAITVDVCALMANLSVCQYDLEQSWLALEMTKGSNADFTVASFMSFFWDTAAMKIAEEVELIRWQGDTASLDTLLTLCDGHLKRLCGDADVIRATQTTVTTANVIAELGEGLQLLPTQMQMRKSDLRYYVSPNIATAYRIATATTNTINNVTKELGLTFLDIPIVECYGLPANTYVLTRKDNLLYVFDAEGDKESMQIVDFSKTTLDRRIGGRADYKVGFYHTNGAEIVFYGDCVAS